MNGPRISIIVAMDEKRGIGKKNSMMWKIPGEQARFKNITTPHPMIMGRKTFESIGRVLPERANIIITRDSDFKVKGAIVVHSLDEALKKAKSIDTDEIFIIGGGQIYEQSINLTDRLYLTLIKGDFKADTFFPDYSDFKKVVSQEKYDSEGHHYTFMILER